MGRYYFSHEETEAYRKGEKDERQRRTNYDFNEYAGGKINEAYFEGRRDERRAEERRREERQQEEAEMERQHQRMLEQQREQDEYDGYIRQELERAQREEESIERKE